MQEIANVGVPLPGSHERDPQQIIHSICYQMLATVRHSRRARSTPLPLAPCVRPARTYSQHTLPTASHSKKWHMSVQFPRPHVCAPHEITNNICYHMSATVRNGKRARSIPPAPCVRSTRFCSQHMLPHANHSRTKQIGYVVNIFLRDNPRQLPEIPSHQVMRAEESTGGIGGRCAHKIKKDRTEP